jgi:methyl-accepting chemotaxis protein
MKRSVYWLSGFKSRLMVVVGAPFLFVSAAAAFLIPMLQSSSPNPSRFQQTLITEALLLGTGIAVLCIVGHFILKPLRQLEVSTQRIIRGETGFDIRMQRNDEIGVLANSLNQLTHYHRTIEQASECCSRGHFDARTLALAEQHPMLRGVATVHSAMEEMRSLIRKMQEGCLDARGDAGKYPGVFGELIQAMHQLMDAIAQPVHEVTHTFESVAHRNLRARMQGSYAGDYGRMKDSVNAALGSLDQKLKQVISHSAGVADGSNQIYCTGQVFAAGAAEQKTTLRSVSENLEEMAGAVHQNSTCALQGKELAEIARASSDRGFESMQRMSNAIELIKTSADATAKIVKTIDDIAFQTNLLALNAAVEAARAGNEGKGFAVVAGEVRNLAMRSAEAARHTAALIEESTRNAETGVAINREVMKNLEEINAQVNLVSSVMIEIASASEQQKQSVENVSQAINQLNTMTQRYVANSSQTAVAAESLSGQAAAMQDLMTSFQLSDGTQTSQKETLELSPLMLDQKLLEDAIRWDA